jgi:hypothetical protein
MQRAVTRLAASLAKPPRLAITLTVRITLTTECGAIVGGPGGSGSSNATAGTANVLGGGGGGGHSTGTLSIG